MFSFDTRLRYSHGDINQKLSIGAIIDLFQDCVFSQSEELGVGPDKLKSDKTGWILCNWQIIIKKRPHVYTDISVCTWPYKFEKFLGYRNFLIKDDLGDVVVCANSIWMYLDIERMIPSKNAVKAGEIYTLEDRYPDMEYAPRKLNSLDELKVVDEFKVRKSNLDFYQHVNNGQYIKMAMEYIPDDFNIGEIRVEYKLSAKLGDMIVVGYHEDDKGTIHITMKNEAGKEYAVMQFFSM